MTSGGSLTRNIDFEVANLEVLRKTRKTLILTLRGVKNARNGRFDAPACLVSSLWFSGGFVVSIGEAAKAFVFEGFEASCHVPLRGRRGIS